VHINTRASLYDEFAVSNLRGARGRPVLVSNQVLVDGLNNDVFDFSRSTTAILSSLYFSLLTGNFQWRPVRIWLRTPPARPTEPRYRDKTSKPA
jgi:hypothetical protein